MQPPRVLTVAGSDPSGGAGIQADLKTFAAWSCYGMAVVTALTAQNTVGVRAVHAAPAGFVGECLDAVLDDCPPAATKTGMLFDPDLIVVVSERLRTGRAGLVVVDPVMVATSGDPLLRSDAVRALVERLLPVASVVTPNLHEAAVLGDMEVRTEADGWRAAARILDLGPAAVLVKGGHGTGGECVDLLLTRGERIRYTRERLPVDRPHGTGCTLSAAIAAGLARGACLSEAVRAAGDWVHSALAGARPVGAGGLPLDHLTPVPGLGQ